MGGTYVDSNVVRLSVADHAEAHRLLWVFYGKREDWIAWKGLSGQISVQDITMEILRDTGRRVAEWRRGTKHSIESRKKMSEAKKGSRHPRYGKFGAENPLFGRKHKLETRHKISRAVSGERHPAFGKTVSDSTRLKISIAQKAYWERRRSLASLEVPPGS